MELEGIKSWGGIKGTPEGMSHKNQRGHFLWGG